MATRFAVASTAWNTPSTWDNGAVPLAGDTVYPNGFTVPIDTDISVDGLNNNIPNIILPNMNIPAMTTNTAPSGIADSSAPTGAFQPYYVFDQIATTAWGSSNTNTGWVSYDYGTNKLIKRYYIKAITVSGYTYPVGWNFEGWNGSSWVVLESKTGMGATINSGYASPLLTHITSYSKYRINITASANITLYTSFSDFQMTESSVTVLGATTGGSFTVPSSLSGTRNIEFTGAGLMGVQAGTPTNTTILSLDNNLTNTVNLNKTSGAYIINPLYNISDGANTIAININNNGIINFNGDLYGTTTNGIGNPNGIIRVVSNPTITVNGNLYPIAGRQTAGAYLFNLLTTSTNATLTINGSIFGSNLWPNAVSIYSQAVNTINVTGTSITSNAGPCITATSTVYLTIVGNISYTNASSVTPITLAGASSVSLTGTLSAPPNAVGISTSGTGAINITGAMTGGTGGTNGACIVSTGTGAINIPTGTITNGTNASAISAVSSSLVTVGNSPIINSNNFMAVYAPRIRFYTGAQIEWTFQTSTGGTKILRNGTNAIGLPSYIHVKIGQKYGPNDSFIGACIIPPASAVGVGIPVSAITLPDTPVPVIVGTLQLTGEDILNAISTSSNVVAERLRNVSTVDSTGNQIVALS